MTLVELDNWPLVKQHIRQPREQQGVDSYFHFACPTCQDMRRVRLQLIHGPPELLPTGGAAGQVTAVVKKKILRPLSVYAVKVECVQCHGTAVLQAVEVKNELVHRSLVHIGPGAAGTPHTPPGVAHYLEEAAAAASVGAHSATIAMLRAAVEFLFYDLGYRKRTLGGKLGELENEIAANTFRHPQAHVIDPHIISVLKNLGDAGIHPNDGDIGRQEYLTPDVTDAYFTVIYHLLHRIYEDPRREQARAQMLTDALDLMKPKKAP